jgi:hypothetical protein
MGLLFRLNRNVEGFENEEKTKFFFKEILPKINNYIFDPFKSTGIKLKPNDIIYFAYCSKI